MTTLSDGPAGSRKSGRSVGDFVISKDIGKGSFAQVYAGLHKVRASHPALFVSPAALAGSGASRAHQSPGTL